MSKPADNKVGKYFEDKLMTPALRELSASYPLFFHKLKDTYSARSFMPTAPSDYLVSYCGRARLVECKASAVHESLTQCLSNAVSDTQVTHHRLWHASGQDSLFLFYSDLTGHVEAWQGVEVVYHRLQGKRLAKSCFHMMHCKTLNPELLSVL